MPYNPATQTGNPYTMNSRELPSNPAVAAKVPSWNTIDPGTGSAYTGASAWAASPLNTPNWGSMLVPPNVTTTPVPSLTSPVASVGWADALIADRQATKVPTVQSVETLANLNTAPHGAVPVQIMGYGFTGATAVNIGGACTAVTVVNDSTITCTTPAAAVAGTANVTVTTPAGTGTLTGGFIYT